MKKRLASWLAYQIFSLMSLIDPDETDRYVRQVLNDEAMKHHE